MCFTDTTQVKRYFGRMPDTTHPFLTWWRANPDVAATQEDMGRLLGCRGQRLSQIFNDSTKPPSPALARRMNRLTGGDVSLAELRPDIWGQPEIVPSEAAQ